MRLISDDLHMDYTALGPTVHLASRMEGLANAGTALLGPATPKLVDGLVEGNAALGAVEVKGTRAAAAGLQSSGDPGRPDPLPGGRRVA